MGGHFDVDSTLSTDPTLEVDAAASVAVVSDRLGGNEATAGSAGGTDRYRKDIQILSQLSENILHLKPYKN
jgi:hypothetical protein